MLETLKQYTRRIDPGFVVVIAISFLAIWPFLRYAGLPEETDAELHIFRLQELTYLLQNGEMYPRWAPNFYHGYGYPIFNYYAPLTYYLGAGIDIWPAFDPVDGVKAVFVLGLLLAGVGMYGFVRDNWGRPAGYVAASVYVYAPYIQFIDPHARGVLAESFSFGMFPLALWSLDRLRRTGGTGAWITAVLMTAAVILSHNLMGLLFFSFLFAWLVWLWLTRSWREGEATLPLGTAVMALFLGLAVAAFFWLPVFLEQDAVNLNTLLGEGDNFDFRTHFLSLGELLAPSAFLDWSSTEPDFRFNLGLTQWVFGLVGAILVWWRQGQQRLQVMFFTMSLLVLLFLMSPLSTLVWEGVPFLPFFQFPWRLLGAAAAMLAILAGAGMGTLLSQYKEGWWRFSPMGLTAVVVALPILFGWPLAQPTPWLDFGEVNMLRMTMIENQGRWLGTTSTADFVPATVDIVPTRRGSVVVGFVEGEPLDRVNYKVLPDGAMVMSDYIRPLHTRYTISTPKDFLFRLFQFDFPGWTVLLDGEPVEKELGRPDGFLVVPVPVGEHTVDVLFGTTPARSMAVMISRGALLLTLVGGFVLSRRKRRGSSLQAEWHSTPVGWWVLVVVVGITAVFVLLVEPTGWLRHQSERYTTRVADEALFADFGEQAALIGYDAARDPVRAGDEIDVRLYWQAQNEMAINFQVFVHILGEDGVPVAQSDKLNPGEFPTRRWPLDKYVIDSHQLTLPADLPPGRYPVSVGLWVQTEGWRLPVLDEVKGQVGDNYVLYELVVE